MIAIRISGDEEVREALARFKGSAGALDGFSLRVATNIPYAIFVHEGTRRMSARPFLADAGRVIRPRIVPALIAAIPKGAAATRAAITDLGLELKTEAQARTPVRTGNLRRSLHMRSRATGLGRGIS